MSTLVSALGQYPKVMTVLIASTIDSYCLGLSSNLQMRKLDWPSPGPTHGASSENLLTPNSFVLKVAWGSANVQ